MKQKYKYIDLFAGAGGMSLGFSQEGFENILAIEIDSYASKTYKKNFPNHKLLEKNICLITDDEIKQIKYSSGVDIIIGGPPCQGFSMAGNIGRKFIDDDRNKLFKEFVRFVSIIEPKIFVMENVSRLKTHNKGQTINEIITEFTQKGYKVTYKVLQTYDYEIAQKRQRIFIVGTKGKEFTFPSPSKKKVNVFDVIHDLPFLNNGESSQIPNHFSMKHTKQMLTKMKWVKEGGNREDIPEDIRPKSGDARKYIRYDRNKPSFTVTGDMRKIFHYDQNRALTSRELARIQSFPDDFIFHGPSISVQQQIGNAVPPKLSNKIAKSVKEHLDDWKKIS